MLALMVGDLLATDIQLYGATFESSVSDAAGSMNDFAYVVGDCIANTYYNANNNCYNGITDGEPYGWFVSEDGDESRIVLWTDTAGGQALLLNTDTGTLTNKLNAATASAIETTLTGGGIVYYEMDVKFEANDVLDCGILGGYDATMFGIYAYSEEGGWGVPSATNLVIYHAFYDPKDPCLVYNGGIGYTNEIFSTLIDTEVYTKIRVEMKQIDE